MKRSRFLLLLLTAVLPLGHLAAQVIPPVPKEKRGRIDAEREGFHDANNIRTVFLNYGMVGNYPTDPIGVDLSVFHSVEVPKGSGLNYTDGITPFVLAKVRLTNGDSAYIMEAGYRERQETSPFGVHKMRFEPRPGYFEPDANVNRGRSPAISNDLRTWPSTWPDKDASWDGWWNGYFGKVPAADQESFTVMDDDYYDKWRPGSPHGSYFPDSRDSTRRGLGLRVEVRGFQWSNPQAANVIFWHYDITNEGTVDYPAPGQPENIIFGLYMDSGIGGSAVSCDGVAESDDDNAQFDTTTGLNLVYTWDYFGRGRGVSSNCLPTGYLGYAYLETPGKPEDLIDNDNDGMIDERRDGGPGILIEGRDAILAAAAARYDTAKFSLLIGSPSRRPAVLAEQWWTGDEDMDWVALADDVGADGLAGTNDIGEGDGMPTEGEPHFDRTDKDESDQIGLTGFQMNYITQGIDNVVFFRTGQGQHPDWPKELYDKWTSPDPNIRFDPRTGATNINIGFLFASGPFTLRAGRTERFSLALAYGADLQDLRSTVKVVQAIYNANYQFAVPPPMPTVKAESGDGYVQLTWDDAAENSTDPVVTENDFEGYRIYRSTDPLFRDPKAIQTGRDGSINGKPLAQFDLVNGISGPSQTIVGGVAYNLGSETGLTHTFRDTTVINGQQYYYAVCSYDYGPSISLQNQEVFTYYPSENAITVSRTPRGGIILPKNVVSVRPNPKVLGYIPAEASLASHIAGIGTGTVSTKVVDSKLVPENHVFKVTFNAKPDEVRANSYNLIDSTTGDVIFETGRDLDGAGTGISGLGVLPIVQTLPTVVVDTLQSGFAPGSMTDAILGVTYARGATLPVNMRREGFPYDLTITFSNTIIDTAFKVFGDPLPVKFRVTAQTPNGPLRLKCYFNDSQGGIDSTLSVGADTPEEIQVLTGPDSVVYFDRYTWTIKIKNDSLATTTPTLGDVYNLKLLYPFTVGDAFVFTTKSEVIENAKAMQEFKEPPYVVPNPYVGAASFEPERYATGGRGEREVQFRGLPQNCVIRIYTVRGELVQTLVHDGSTHGVVRWNLRTKDNLDIAPGLYVFHADAGNYGSHIGKFAIIK